MPHITYIDALICDYNGFIAQDAVECWRASSAVIRKLGGAPISYPAMRKMLNGPGGNWLPFYRACGVDADESEIAELYYSICKQYRRSVELAPGAYETLMHLHDSGMKLCIASGYLREVILDEIERFGLARCFPPQRVVAAKIHVDFRKDEMFLKLLDVMRMSPKDAAAAGDMPFEMRAATKLGMHAIGYLGGLGTRASLMSAGAEQCIRKFSSLRLLLRKG